MQIDFLAAQGVSRPHVREIVSAHLHQLGEHKFSRIAQEMRISGQQVTEAAQFIKKFLNPFPAQGASGKAANQVGQMAYVLPDVIISKRDHGFEVDVVESKRIFLRINPLYRELLLRAQQPEERLNEEEKKHIHQYVSRARLFMANIDQRRQTLQRIAAYLVAHQGPEPVARHDLLGGEPLLGPGRLPRRRRADEDDKAGCGQLQRFGHAVDVRWIAADRAYARGHG